MQSKVIRADYRYDNSSSMKKRLLRTKKTTEDRPTPADADSVPLVNSKTYVHSLGLGLEEWVAFMTQQFCSDSSEIESRYWLEILSVSEAPETASPLHCCRLISRPGQPGFCLSGWMAQLLWWSLTLCWWWLIWPIQNDSKPWKIIETLAHGLLI